MFAATQYVFLRGALLAYRKFNPDSFVSEENGIDRRVSEILILLQARPNLRAAQLAPIVGLTKSRLHHLFKKEVGINIGTYAKRIQLTRAAELLKETHRSLKEIRNEIGIPNAPNFVRHFKRRFGISPSAYRQLHNSRIDEHKAG